MSEPEASPDGSGQPPRAVWWRAPRTWAIAACVAIAFALAAPMIVYCPGGLGACRVSLDRAGGTDDWRAFSSLWEASRVALADFHQFPSWNPYHCGGLVLYQDPESPFPGPLFLLTFFWLSTPVAMKVWILAHLVIGALGARALVADRGGNAAEQILAATVTAACGFFAEHIGGGHLSFTSFLYLPFIVWAFRRSLRDLRYAVMVAALFALTVIEGGTYPAPLMAVALAAESLARLGSREDRRALARVLPLVAALFVLLAALRLLPALHYLREHPRLEPLDDKIGLSEIFSFWVTRAHGRRLAGHGYVWPEYDDYVGVVPVALMLAGAAIALFGRDPQRRARRIDLAVFAVLIWCALGNISGPSLFAGLHALPVFHSLRVPSRFLGPAMVTFGLLAAAGLAAARGALVRWRPRFRRAIEVAELALVVAVAVDVCLVNQPILQQGLDPAMPRRPASADFFQNPAASYARLPSFPTAGFGTRGCYVPLEWRPAFGITDGRGPQARLEPPAAGTIAATAWSPNRLDFDLRLAAPATLIVNQNYETGWQADGGESLGAYVVREGRFWDIRARPRELPVKGAIGLLAVQVPAGSHHLTLRHRPPWLLSGVLLSLLGIALSVLVVRRALPAKLIS
ncbi:MAG TPA: hypothetical protein VHG72_05470 [Polyangia bacterium]|nr:hypothetical protein [Polyangia bacterium]